MVLQDELTRVAEALAEAEAEAWRWGARVEGLRAELAALQRALDSDNRRVRSDSPLRDLRLLKRTTAIEEVLRGSAGPMRISAIVKELSDAGRTSDDYSVVAATLQQLLSQNRVRRPSRGQYQAV